MNAQQEPCLRVDATHVIPLTFLWPQRPIGCNLAEHEIHVWCADLDAAVWREHDVIETLSGDERSRASKFCFERDRNRFVRARGSVRRVLGSYMNTAPRRIEFAYGANGKPSLDETCSDGELHFNMAHSDNVWLVAVSRCAEVGVDVEQIRPL